MARVSISGGVVAFGSTNTRRRGSAIRDINGGCAYLIISNEVGYVCASGDA